MFDYMVVPIMMPNWWVGLVTVICIWAVCYMLSGKDRGSKF